MKDSVTFKNLKHEPVRGINLEKVYINNSAFYLVTKRLIDIVCSLCGLILFSPIFLTVSILIKLEDKGPIIFKQIRIGKDDKLFYIYKFRSMKEGTPNKSTAEFSNVSDYTTRIGRFIRKTSIDELPQLFNILKGNMSIVGPRPVIPSEVELVELRNIYNVNTILPGITGWAQINGRDHVDVKDKVEYDYYYLLNRNLFLDIKIIVSTIFKVIKSEGIK